MIDAAPAHLRIVLDILEKYAPECEARVFGSRHTHTAKSYSDLDLVLIGRDRLDINQMGKIKEAFQESILPYRVDVLDWYAISPEFQKVIENNGYEIIQKRHKLP
jgi:predicted nucleotidyltransferase